MSFRKRKIICRPVSRFVQVPSTAPHGFLIPEKESSKMPCEGECASPTGPSPSDSMKDTEATEPSQKKAKSSQHVSGHGASSKSQQGPDDFQGCTSGGAYGFNPPPYGSDASYQGLPLGSHFPGGGAMHSGPPMSSSSAGAATGIPHGFNPPPFGSHFPSGGGMPSGPPPMSSSSAGATPGALYHKAGYSVVITNGFLYHSSDNKGVVMMKSGTQFFIAIANDNSHGK